MVSDAEGYLRCSAFKVMETLMEKMKTIDGNCLFVEVACGGAHIVGFVELGLWVLGFGGAGLGRQNDTIIRFLADTEPQTLHPPQAYCLDNSTKRVLHQNMDPVWGFPEKPVPKIPPKIIQSLL